MVGYILVRNKEINSRLIPPRTFPAPKADANSTSLWIFYKFVRTAACTSNFEKLPAHTVFTD